ncbi:hypothetical protein M9Y10_036445 [Tritrichomonas musculus]|uniref:Surface antigen BspA-like n=1 Tax=Tritrichomonas musculus TaxID=1915356 RepID=A0ABR2GU24_9EUKA
MNGKESFKIFYNDSEYKIPSDFPKLCNVNSEIYQSLLSKGQYEIKSYITNYTVYKSFIDHWIKNKTTFIYPFKISDYEYLSNEFDQMKEIIQITRKKYNEYGNNSDKYDLMVLNEQLKKEIKKLQKIKLQKTKKYQQTILSLFSNDNFYPNLHNTSLRQKLSLSIQNNDIDTINLCTQKVIQINGLVYSLNKKNKEAAIIDCSSEINGIFIPKSIKYELNEYLVTEIKRAFKSKKNIKSIQFGDDSELKIIGEEAFSGTSIELISIPKKVTKIMSKSFSNCTKLKSVFFSNQSELTYIGEFAFDRTSIEKISIPDKVKSIGQNCFGHCGKLREVTFSEDSKLQCIKQNTFQSKVMERFKVPPHVFIIKTYAFKKCENLKVIEFSENSKIFRLEKNCFNMDSLESITLPSRVVELENGWCEYLNKLNSIQIIVQAKKRIDIYANEFIIGKSSPSKSCLNSIIIAARNIQRITIPSFIKRISSYAFYNCSALESVTFEDNSKLESIDQFAFSNTRIKSITIPKNVIEIGGNSFAHSFLENVTFSKDSKLKCINQNAFCFTQLKSVNIPPHVRHIGRFAFCGCDKLLSVVFDVNSEIETIEYRAFDQTNLESITLPTSIKKVQSSAFSKCNNLKSVTFSEPSQIKIIENQLFSYSSLKSFTIPSSVVSLESEWHDSLNLKEFNVHSDNKFFAKFHDDFILAKSKQENDVFGVLVYANKSIKKAVIPSFVKEIAPSSFIHCELLESIEFSENSQLRTIGSKAFQFTFIRDVSFPASLVKIEEFSFSNCINLENVTFSEDSELKYIGEGAFSESKIKMFTLPSNVEYIGGYAFNSCPVIQKVDFSEHSKIESFESSLFQYSSLSTLVIPPKLKELKYEWCVCADNLTDIFVSPLNKNFIFYENKFLLGKSDPNNDIYDILYFARRDIEFALIPSFVTKISNNSFMNCKKLRKIEFQRDSKLKIICDSAFINNGFESITIPRHVVEIEKFAFASSKLKRVTFQDNSELKCIQEFAFDYLKLSSIILPSEVAKIIDAFTQCDDLSIVEIDENSKLKAFDFGGTFLLNGIVMVPAKLVKSFQAHSSFI